MFHRLDCRFSVADTEVTSSNKEADDLDVGTGEIEGPNSTSSPRMASRMARYPTLPQPSHLFAKLHEAR